MNTILRTCVLTVFFGCGMAEQPQIVQLAPSQLIPGPVVSVLTEDQRSRLARINTTLQEVDPTPLAELLDQFSRDHNPESEIVIWEQIASAYARFVATGDRSPAAKREAFGLLLMRSGSPEEDVLKQPLTALTSEEAVLLLHGYTLSPDPITVTKQ